MTSHTKVEATQAIARQTVTTTLQDDSLWSVPFHNALDDGLENALVGHIVDPISEREVDGIMFAMADTDVAELTRSREVFSVLVE